MNITQAQIDALRDAAREYEHDAEFNMTIASRWSPARQKANNIAISRSRELHARADALEKQMREQVA